MFTIAARLRQLRDERNLSQGDIQKRTGLIRCYISRVENGHTVPSLETLERLAKAFDMPLYQIFYSHKDGPAKPYVPIRKSLEALAKEPGKAGEEARFLLRLRRLLARISEKDKALFLHAARKLATRRAPA